LYLSEKDGIKHLKTKSSLHACVFKPLFSAISDLLNDKESLLASVLHVLAAGAFKCNETKKLIMGEGLPTTIVKLISSCKLDKTLEAAFTLAWLTLIDDDKDGISSSFMYADLYQEVGMIPLLVNALCKLSDERSPKRSCQLLRVIESMLLSDKICREFLDFGLITQILNNLKLEEKDTELKLLLGCLKRIAHSEVGKQKIMAHNGLQIVHELLRNRGLKFIRFNSDVNISLGHKHEHEHVIERALAMMSSMSLRNKEVAAGMYSDGSFETVVEIMRIYLKTPSIERHCCMYIRNCVVHDGIFKVLLYHQPIYFD
jgi:hypothetical protein